MKKILIVVGTRPEAIKMIPLWEALKREPKYIQVKLCITAQHQEILKNTLAQFSVRPDFSLDIQRTKSSLNHLTAQVIEKLQPILEEYQPDWVLVHGDTTTTLSASLAAFYSQISVGHVEAGLRSNNIYAPFPEEVNRKLTTHIAKIHFAPTEDAKQNLLKENISEDAIHVVGNTVIDMLLHTLRRIEAKTSEKEKVIENITQSGYLLTDRKFVLITAHRRESFGQGLENICRAIRKLAIGFPKIDWIYTVHPNPKVQNTVRKYLSDTQNIYLLPSLEYVSFVYLMSRSHLMITDSGGIQEEAPSLRKPLFVMREVTERPEVLATGMVKLVGTTIDKIFSSVDEVLRDSTLYRKMTQGKNPFGNGTASLRIANILKGN